MRGSRQQGFAAVAALLLLATAAVASAVLYQTLGQDQAKLGVEKSSVGDERLAKSAAAIVQSFYKIPAGVDPVLYPKPYVVGGGRSLTQTYTPPPTKDGNWAVTSTDGNGAVLQLTVPDLHLGQALATPGMLRTYGGVPTTSRNVAAQTLGYNRERPGSPYLITSVDQQIGKRRFRIDVDPPPPPTCTLTAGAGTRVLFNSSQSVALSAAGIVVRAELIIDGAVSPVAAAAGVPFPANASLDAPLAAVPGGVRTVNVGPRLDYKVLARVYGPDGRSNTCQLVFNSSIDPPICTVTRLSPATIVQGAPATFRVDQIGGGPATQDALSTVSQSGPWASFPPTSYSFPGGVLTSDGPFAVRNYTVYGQSSGPGGTAACTNTAAIAVAPPTVCEVAVDSPGYIVATQKQPQTGAHVRLISGIVSSQSLAWDGLASANGAWTFDGTQPGMDRVRWVKIDGSVQGPYQSASCTPGFLQVRPTDPTCYVALSNQSPLDLTDWSSQTTASIVVTNAQASQPQSYGLHHPVNGWMSQQSIAIAGPQLAGAGDSYIVWGSVVGATGVPVSCTSATIPLLPACHMGITGSQPLVRGDPNSCVDVWVGTDQGTPLVLGVSDANGWAQVSPGDPRKRYCGSDFANIGPTTWSVTGQQGGPYGSKTCGNVSFQVVNPPPPTCSLGAWPWPTTLQYGSPASTTVGFTTNGYETSASIAWNGTGVNPVWNGWSYPFSAGMLPPGLQTLDVTAWVQGYGGSGSCHLAVPIVSKCTYPTVAHIQFDYDPLYPGYYTCSGDVPVTRISWLGDSTYNYLSPPYHCQFPSGGPGNSYGWQLTAQFLFWVDEGAPATATPNGTCPAHMAGPVGPQDFPPAQPMTHACFAPGTEIQLATGGTKPIEALKPGDLVWDPLSGASHVIATVDEAPRPADLLVELGYGRHRLRVTGNHPVMTPGGLHAARRLRPGDLVYDADGRTQALEIARIVPGVGQSTYNVTFAGADAAVMSNLVVADGFVTGNASLETKSMLDGIKVTARLEP